MIFVKINNNKNNKKKRKKKKKKIKTKKLVSSTCMRKQYFVANNLLGEWRSMQMTVISEGLLLNSKYIKMGREEEGLQAFLTQPPLVLFAMRFDGYPFTALRP